ncbi:glycosyltransferase family 31 protein, partial [Aureobasidium melanogenum]
MRFSHLFRDILSGVIFPELRSEWDNLSQDSIYTIKLPRTKAQAHKKPDERTGEPTVESDPNSSPDACNAACEAVETCFQWAHLNFTTVEETKQFSGGVCYLSSVFRFGNQRPEESWVDEKNATNIHLWNSGWKTAAIESWLVSAPDSCQEIDWT